MKRFKGWKKKGFLGISVLMLVLLFCFGMNQDGEIRAAEEEKVVIEIAADAGIDDYEVRTTTSKIKLIKGNTDISDLIEILSFSIL